MAEFAIAVYVWGFGSGVFTGVLLAAWLIRAPSDGAKGPTE